MNYKFQIGDQVKYVYPDYFSAMKSDYSMSWCNESSSLNDKYLKNGGTYEIIKRRHRYILIGEEYKIANSEDWVSSKYFVSSVLICPYAIDDRVRFTPISKNKKEISYLEFFSGLKVDKDYKILKIINEYYVILKRKKTTVLLTNESPPIRWIDLSKI